MAKKNKVLSLFEIVWYSVCGAFALWALTYIIIGTVVNYVSINSPFAVADRTIKKTFGLGFLYWGFIMLSVVTIAVIVVLLSNAKKADRTYEKEQRRAARLASIHADETPNAIDVEVKAIKVE